MTVALVTYLLNALWQAPLLFVAAWLLSFAVRRLGPRAEHRLWIAALVAQVVLPACSVPALAPALAAFFHAWFHAADAGSVSVTVTLGNAQPLVSSGVSVPVQRVCLALYAAFVAFFLLRFAMQSYRIRAIRMRSEPVVLPPLDSAFFQACTRTLAIARVSLMSASDVATPLTFGLHRPLLLLPHDFTRQVSSAQLRAALAHELAHVSRRDYLKQVLYRLVALPLCFHPATAFTLTRITETREQVCDSVAAEITGGGRPYAAALLELASMLAVARPTHSHAIGIFDASRFERRILMLHHVTPSASRTLRLAVISGSLALAAVTCTSALALRFNLNTLSAPAPQEESSAKRMKIAPGIAAGQSTHKVQPVYPAEAKKAKISGIVLLHAIIGKDGAIQNLSVISGPEELRASAIDAVRQWTYKPFLLNGQPTEVETTITVNYSFGE